MVAETAIVAEAAVETERSSLNSRGQARNACSDQGCGQCEEQSQVRSGVMTRTLRGGLPG